MTHPAIIRRDTFIPKGTGLSTVDFSRGDCIGSEKRAAAVADAVTQRALQPPGSVREKLYALQESLGPLPELECPLQHVFAPGVYARTIHIPKGGVLIGKIHKHRHLNILGVGRVSVMTEFDGVLQLEGYLVMVSEPGTKRAVYAETDVVWTTIHLTGSTDLATIENEVIAKNYEEYEAFVRDKGVQS